MKWKSFLIYILMYGGLIYSGEVLFDWSPPASFHFLAGYLIRMLIESEQK